RYQSWEEAQTVDTDALFPALEALTADLRERSRELVSLPDGESIEIELVQDEPWLAFNYYQGDLCSRVAFNTDLPWRSIDLLTVVAHELYPGHHTEAVLKEQLLVRDRGQLEESILMIGTPVADRRGDRHRGPRGRGRRSDRRADGRAPAAARDPVRRLDRRCRPRTGDRARIRREQLRAAPPRARSADRRGTRIRTPVVSALGRDDRQGLPVHHRRHVARLRVLLHRRPQARAEIRRRGCRALPAPARRATRPGG